MQQACREAIELPQVERSEIRVDVAQIGSYEQASQWMASVQPTRYRELREGQVAHLAGQHSTLGNLLEGERCVVLASHEGTEECSREGLARVLTLRRNFERNRAAAASLELFYRLAEAESGLDHADRALEILRGTTADLEVVEDVGIQGAPDKTDLERRRITLLAERTQAEVGRVQITSQLQSLLGIADSAGDLAIWPVADWEVIFEPLDEQQAVQVGLANRSDLAVLRYVCQLPDQCMLPAIRQILSAQDASLGLAPSLRNLFLGPKLRELLGASGDEEQEAALRRQQLRGLIRDRERSATHEIREAVHVVGLRLQQVALAKERLASWRKRVHDLEALWEAGSATPLELRIADLALIEAEQQLAHHAISWKIARMRLRESQGLLSGADER